MSTIHVSLTMLGEDASITLNEMIRDAKPGTRILLEKGDYRMFTPIVIEKKSQIIFDGNGSTLIPYFNREKDEEPGTEVFHCSDSKQIKLCNFKVCASQSANTAVRFLDVNEEYADIEVHAAEPFNGKEFYCTGMNFTDDGRPLAGTWVRTHSDISRRGLLAGEIAITNPIPADTPHEQIGEQRYRVYSTLLKLHGIKPEEVTDVSCKHRLVRPGMLGNIEHSLYRLSAFVFRSCEEVTVEDVAVTNYGGFCFVILPRCKDFVFRRIRIQTEDFEHQPYSINGDGIHITGLSGKLVVEDCYFERLGDDTINLHTQTHLMRDIGLTCAKPIHNKICGVVPAAWTRSGDRLRVYDPQTLTVKGELEVEDFKDGIVVYKPISFELTEEDYVVNTAYYPDVTIRRCVVRHPRGRAYCLQSVGSLLFENCLLDTVGDNASIYLSAGFPLWYEAGIVKDVVIRNNRFTGRNLDYITNNGVIHAWVYGGAEYQKLFHIHKNITVEKNIFENIDVTPIYLSMTDGVTVKDNLFVNCHAINDEHIVIRNCTDVICEGNYLLHNSERVESIPHTETEMKVVSDISYHQKLNEDHKSKK